MNLKTLDRDPSTGNHKDALMFPSSQMYKRFLDNTLLERQRKCTIFSKPISLILEDKTGKDRLFNVIDTPGHPDFLDEVVAALEISDGAILLLDVVEGLTIETKNILQEVIKRQIDLVVVINKLDRLIVEMRIPPEDAYLKIKMLVDEVNLYLDQTNPDVFCQRELNPGFYKNSEGLLQTDRKTYKALVTKSNVLFASSKYHFMFSLESFSEIYFQELKGILPKRLGVKFLWGDVYFKRDQNRFIVKKKKLGRRKDSSSNLEEEKTSNGGVKSESVVGLKRTFVEFVLEPLYKIFSHCVAKEDTELREFCLKLGLVLPKKNLFNLSLKKLLQTIFGACLFKPTDFVEMILRRVSDSLQGNKRILQNIMVQGDLNKSGKKSENEFSQYNNRLLIYFSKIYPEIPSEGGVPENFHAFGRILSGSLNIASSAERVFVLVNEGYKQEFMYYDDRSFEALGFNKLAEEEKFQVRLESLFVNNTNYKIKVDNAYPGNLIMLPMMGNVINKTGFLFEMESNQELTQQAVLSQQILLKMPRYASKSFVKLGLEPLKPSELPQMLQGLRALNKILNGLKTRVEESGEHLIFGTGELLTDSAMHLLREVFTKIEVRVTEPTATFSETVIQTSKTFASSNTPNKLNRLSLVTQPLEREIFGNVEYLNNVRPSLRSEFVREYSPKWDELEVQGLWTFGPEEDYPNALVEDLLMTRESKSSLFGYDMGEDSTANLKDFIMNGFNWGVREGPLCEEPIQHCKIKISNLELHNDPQMRNAGQIIPTMRKVMHASFLLSSPRLLEPVYDIEILCSQDSLPSVYNVLSRRRGQLISEKAKPGTPLFQVLARLPVLDSFGFEIDLKCHTIGQASTRAVFGGWEIIPGDPLDTDITVRNLEPAEVLGLAKDVMVKTRRRKGLAESVSLVKYFDDELVLQSIREKDIFKGVL